jgi:hypothetical protein
VKSYAIPYGIPGFSKILALPGTSTSFSNRISCERRDALVTL